MKVVSLSLPLIVACSDSCDSEFSSALQTRGRTSAPCIAVERGAVAPVRGTFHSLDGSFDAEEVDQGTVAPVAGKFCVADHAALLERSRSTASAGGKVESALHRKKEDFALKSIGPFNLVPRNDIQVTLGDEDWSVEQSKGSLARSLQLDEVASYSWLGAKDVSWAYQSENAVPGAGSFENYGGFILKNGELGDIPGFVLEIDNEASAEEVAMTLEFSHPFSIQEKHWKRCKNPAPVTIPFMVDQGALEYCWATSQSRKECETGCFLYKTKVGEEVKYQGFSVMKQYPLKELGPFALHSRPDLISKFEKKRNKQWSLSGGPSGRMAATQTLGADGSNFWQQATELEWAYQPKETSQDEGPFEQFGGFVLMDEAGEVMDIMEIGSGGGDESMSVSFSKPFWITQRQWKKCSNPAPITIAALSEKGAKEYCWFTDDKQCERGCFYYNTVAGYMAFSARGFALPSLGPFPLIIREDLVSNMRLEGETWRLEGSTGSGELGSTLALDAHGQNFWFGSDEVDWAFQNHNQAELDGNFEKYGGFVLKSSGTPTHVMEIDVLASEPDMTLHFTEPFHITPQAWSNCQNPAPITIAALSDVGAQEYCWETGDDCPNGCFLYKTTSGYQAFAAKDFALKSLGPFDLVERPDLLNEAEFPTLIAGQELKLDTDAEKQFWLGAVSVTWMFPKGDLARNAAVGGFKKYGGFLLKDAENQVMRVLEIDNQASAEKVVLTLNFDPMHIPAAKFDSCLNHRAVTIQTLVDAGVEEYCWEGSAALESCQFGCFLYKTNSGHQAFSVGSG